MIAWLQPFLPSLLGGIVIGLAAGGLYLFTGRIAGVSGVLGGAVLLEPGPWRWAFVGGLIVAGIGAALLGRAAPPALLSTPPALLAGSGLIVGLGAAIGSGCTSGHGVCGFARLSPRSLIAVVTFMATAIITVFVLRHGAAS
ncbi:MAG: YeeE/YedE family protein [Pseudomonadota bacterium]